MTQQFAVTPEEAEEELSAIIEALGTIEDMRGPDDVREPWDEPDYEYEPEGEYEFYEDEYEYESDEGPFAIGAIILQVVAAVTEGADSWGMVADCGELYKEMYPEILQECLHTEQAPTQDVIRRVISLVSPAVLERMYVLWCNVHGMPEETPVSLRGFKRLDLSGKTTRAKAGRAKKALRTGRAWDPQLGAFFRQLYADEIANEAIALPAILQTLDLHGYIVTCAANVAQTKTAQIILDQGGAYLMEVTDTKKALFEYLKDYAEDPALLHALEKEGLYEKTAEEADGRIEIREYWQTDDVEHVPGLEDWTGLRTIGFSRNTVQVDGKAAVASQAFVSNLGLDIEQFARAVCGQWRIESMDNTFDITVEKGASRTIERTMIENLDVVRKWMYTILRNADIGESAPGASMRSKRFLFRLDPIPLLRMLGQHLTK